MLVEKCWLHEQCFNSIPAKIRQVVIVCKNAPNNLEIYKLYGNYRNILILSLQEQKIHFLYILLNFFILCDN